MLSAGTHEQSNTHPYAAMHDAEMPCTPQLCSCLCHRGSPLTFVGPLLCDKLSLHRLKTFSRCLVKLCKMHRVQAGESEAGADAADGWNDGWNDDLEDPLADFAPLDTDPSNPLDTFESQITVPSQQHDSAPAQHSDDLLSGDDWTVSNDESAAVGSAGMSQQKDDGTSGWEAVQQAESAPSQAAAAESASAQASDRSSRSKPSSRSRINGWGNSNSNAATDLMRTHDDSFTSQDSAFSSSFRSPTPVGTHQTPRGHPQEIQIQTPSSLGALQIPSGLSPPTRTHSPTNGHTRKQHPSGANQIGSNPITADSLWEDVKGIIGDAGRASVHSRGGAVGSPFGPTFVHGYPGVAFEVSRNGRLASVTLFEA